MTTFSASAIIKFKTRQFAARFQHQHNDILIIYLMFTFPICAEKSMRETNSRIWNMYANELYFSRQASATTANKRHSKLPSNRRFKQKEKNVSLVFHEIRNEFSSVRERPRQNVFQYLKISERKTCRMASAWR